MSRESRKRLRESTVTAARHQRSGRTLRLVIGALLACALTTLWWWWAHLKTDRVEQASGKPHGFVQPTNFASLCALNTNDLAKCDIALMNLLCTEGLRGAENLNVRECLERLDGIAKHVKAETDRQYYKFRQHPEEFDRSEGKYRMMMMVTVLQQDLGIRYNPARIPQPNEPLESSAAFFADSRDVFIHGLARKQGMGTCSSMPVFLTAIGRRLGYPLNLVRAKGHLFARWDEGERSFNIEGTTLGFISNSDEHYRKWPFPFSAEEERTESYLKPLSPVQELTTFLSIRGMACDAAGKLKHAVGAYAQAFYKEPESIGHQKLFAWAEEKAFDAGVLPKRAALQYAVRSLTIPPGPMQSIFVIKKAKLDAMIQRGAPESEIEREFELLEGEMNAHQKRPR